MSWFSCVRNVHMFHFSFKNIDALFLSFSVYISLFHESIIRCILLICVISFQLFLQMYKCVNNSWLCLNCATHTIYQMICDTYHMHSLLYSLYTVQPHYSEIKCQKVVKSWGEVKNWKVLYNFDCSFASFISNEIVHSNEDHLISDHLLWLFMSTNLWVRRWVVYVNAILYRMIIIFTRWMSFIMVHVHLNPINIKIEFVFNRKNEQK